MSNKIEIIRPFDEMIKKLANSELTEDHYRSWIIQPSVWEMSKEKPISLSSSTMFLNYPEFSNIKSYLIMDCKTSNPIDVEWFIKFVFKDAGQALLFTMIL